MAKGPAQRAEREWRWDAYIDWLCMLPKDRTPGTQREFAESIGTDGAVLVRWRKEPEFLRLWEARYRQTVGSLEKQQAVLDSLYKAATDLDDPRMVTAAKAFLEAVDGVKPRKMDITVTPGKAAAALTDEELMAMLADRAARELEARNAVIAADEEYDRSEGS